MDDVRHTIGRGRRRLFIHHALMGLAWGFMGGCLLAMALLFLHRSRVLGDGDFPMAWALAALAVAAVVISLGVAQARQPTADSVAAIIDQRLALKDRLSTGLFCQTTSGNGPFAEHVIREAQQAAKHADVAVAFPIQLTPIWYYVPVVAMLLAAMFWLLPPDMDPFGLAAARQRRQLAQQQAAQSQVDLQAAIQAIDALPQRSTELQDAGLTEAMRQLASLSDQELRNPTLQRQAAAELSQASDRVSSMAEQTQSELETIQNTLSRLETPAGGPTQRFAQALRRGDFAAAAKAVQELADQINQMDGPERQQLKQQLDDLAQQLQDAASQQLAQQQGEKPNGENGQDAQDSLTGQPPALTPELAQTLSQMAQALEEGDPQAGDDAAQQASDQLQQLAQMQQQLQQYRQAQQQLQQAMQNLGGQCQNPELCQGQCTGACRVEGAAAQGGWEAGTGEGGDPMGQERQMTGQSSSAFGDVGHGQGRIIASWLSDGGAVKGDAQVEFDTAISEARSDAERAIAEDRVPQRYHQTIRRYFDQLPESLNEVQDQAPADTPPPPAPR